MYGIGIAKGMLMTMRSMFRPPTTVQYPEETRHIPPRARTNLLWFEERCTGCSTCAQACPDGCILVATTPREDGSLNIDRYEIDFRLCMYCGLCVEACPYEAIQAGGPYDDAVYVFDNMYRDKHTLTKMAQEHLRTNDLHLSQRKEGAAARGGAGGEGTQAGPISGEEARGLGGDPAGRLTQGDGTAVATIIVDGNPLEAPEGAPLLEVLRHAGIYIPSLCYLEGLPPYAGCRMCLVEIEGARGLQLSCTSKVADGMQVRTNTRELAETRKAVLSIILANHSDRCLTCHRVVKCKPGDTCLRDNVVTHRCLTCSRNYRCELQTTCEMVGMAGYEPWVGEERSYYQTPPPPADRANPFLEFDPQMCIICTRCVRACDEIRHTGAITLASRGWDARIEFGAGGPIHESNCDFCGACIDVCPTATLMEKPNKWAATETEAWVPDRLRLLQRRLHLEPGCEEGARRYRAAGPRQPREPRPALRARPLPLRLREVRPAPGATPHPSRRRTGAGFLGAGVGHGGAPVWRGSRRPTGRRPSASWARPSPPTKRTTC